MKRRTKTVVVWPSFIADLAIMFLALTISVWQDNPKYLWLLAIMVFSGGYWVKE